MPHPARGSQVKMKQRKTHNGTTAVGTSNQEEQKLHLSDTCPSATPHTDEGATENSKLSNQHAKTKKHREESQGSEAARTSIRKRTDTRLREPCPITGSDLARYAEPDTILLCVLCIVSYIIYCLNSTCISYIYYISNYIEFTTILRPYWYWIHSIP